MDDALASALDQSPPTILNSDGDEVVFCRVRFPLRSEGAAAEIRERLRTIPAFQEENEGFWNWIEPRQPAKRQSSGKLASRAVPHQGPSVRVTLDTGDTVLGTIELTGKALVLEANSRERAERGMANLAELAGALVGPALTEIETLEQVMAGRDGDVHQDRASDLPAELQTELVHEALTDHYRKTLDEPISALGDLSPRAAVQTAAGRRKVVDWLKHIENQSKSGGQPDDPMVSYDFTWLWGDLGLEKLRR
ncbi:hypothetical protein [Microvirga splendida]|uniref:DUF2384 domain-containing protein n=1 Tax=Microvirga splendida TaxID=2795727 RepID=A0ABS0Y5C9_9HYPH|nr:hypothetical protein [Microvirga splendida]MBJ6127492.1 hypothetical protein [Microvirga splendida]